MSYDPLVIRAILMKKFFNSITKRADDSNFVQIQLES